MRLIAVLMAVGAFAQPLSAFQEEGGGPGKGAAVPAEAPAPTGAALPSKNLNLKVPEVSLGQKASQDIQRTELRHEFDPVTLKSTSRRFDAFLSSHLELSFVKTGFVAEQMHGLGTQVLERKKA